MTCSKYFIKINKELLLFNNPFLIGQFPAISLARIEVMIGLTLLVTNGSKKVFRIGKRLENYLKKHKNVWK